VDLSTALASIFDAGAQGACPDCALCARNAALLAGMAGCGPCPILEGAAARSGSPAEWSQAPGGSVSCAAFLAMWDEDAAA